MATPEASLHNLSYACFRLLNQLSSAPDPKATEKKIQGKVPKLHQTLQGKRRKDRLDAQFSPKQC